MKPGYKQTEIGMIPEDWEVSSLSREYDLFAGGDLDVSDYSAVRTSTYKYWILSNGLTNNGIYGFCSNPKYHGNSITITGRGDIGHCTYRAEPFSAIVRLLVCQPKREIVSKYISDYLAYEKPFVFESTGVPQLTVPQIKNTKIPKPTTAEQQRIAEALSDMDELIATLEKLVTKKKAIKQGAMQELLTGKRRLPGFSGEWEETTIASIGTIVTGSTPSRSNTDFWGGKHAWVSARDFKSKYIDTTVETVTDLGRKECHFVPKGAVLVTCIASIGLNAIAACECATNQQINAIVCKPEYDNEYVYYQICSQNNVLKAIAGQTAVPIVSKTQFENLSILVPSSFEEQQQIGETLATLDDELSVLEGRLNKARQIKQGMMQQLLTGQIRLI